MNKRIKLRELLTQYKENPSIELEEEIITIALEQDNFVVTKEWINKNCTVRGGYTAKQLRALGVGWPAEHGWKHRANGTTISIANKLIFESRV